MADRRLDAAAGKLSAEQLQGIAQQSCAVLTPWDEGPTGIIARRAAA